MYSPPTIIPFSVTGLDQAFSANPHLPPRADPDRKEPPTMPTPPPPRQLDAFNVGRTISEQDRQLLEDLLGVTNARTLSDRDVYYVLQSIQNNPELQAKINQGDLSFQAEINDLMEE